MSDMHEGGPITGAAAPLMPQAESVAPAPELVKSIWGQNIVCYRSNNGAIYGGQYWWRVPQRLGTMFLETQADQEIVLRNGGGRYGSPIEAGLSITWRMRASYPIWRAAIWLRDVAFAIEGYTPQARKRP